MKSTQMSGQKTVGTGSTTVKFARAEEEITGEAPVGPPGMSGAMADTQAAGDRGDVKPTAEELEPTRHKEAKAEANKDSTEEYLYMIRQARKAGERGDTEGEAAFLKLIARLFGAEDRPGENTSEKKRKKDKSQQVMSDTQEEREEKGTKEQRKILFIAGTVPNNNDYYGLPSYYENNVRNLSGSIPLTIFDPEWQQRAAAYSTDYRAQDTSSSDEGQQYTGNLAPDEWSQSFKDWTLNYRWFHAAIKDVYNFDILAEWILAHKKNVDDIMVRDGFCVGLRYDLKVRMNAFQCEIIRDEKQLFPDISILNKHMANTAYNEARSHDELVYKENPYLPGRAKEDLDPYTGNLKPGASHQQKNDRSASHTNLYQDQRVEGGGGYASSSLESYRSNRTGGSWDDGESPRGGYGGEDRYPEHPRGNWQPNKRARNFR